MLKNMSSPSSLPTVTALKTDPGLRGKAFTGVFLLQKQEVRTTKTNNPFRRLEFADRTGSFSTNLFSDSPLYQAAEAIPEGAVCRIKGQWEAFNDMFSPRLSDLQEVAPGDVRRQNLLAQLVESCPENLESLYLELIDAVGEIQEPKLQATVKSVLNDLGDDFKTSPAAVSMHHAYRGGLLEHTVHMVRAARALFPVYPEVHHDLALAGIILHDIGKIAEYEGDLTYRRSRIGILQGHVVLGYRLVRKAGLQNHLSEDLLERLEHIILSHQGEMEWGAAALAATPEAVFVSMVDNLDAKMGMVQRLLRQGGNQPFSDRHPGLGTSLLLTSVNPSGDENPS